MKIFYLFLMLSLPTMAGLPPTTSKVSSDSTDVVTFKYRFPNFAGTHTGPTLSLGINSVAGGGTGLGTLTSGSLLVGAGTSNITFIAPGTSGNILQSNGSAWTSVANPAAPVSNAICSGETGGCDVQMVVFGTSTGCLSPCTTGTCSICQQVGTKITSVTFSSTGSYNINGLDQTKWACSASGHSNSTGQFYVGWTSPTNGSASSVNVQFGIGTSPVNTGGITAICVGKP